MVAPFCGCLVGGFLYDAFIYTGPESPINSPYMGLPHLFRPDKAVHERWQKRSMAYSGSMGSMSTAVDIERIANGANKYSN